MTSNFSFIQEIDKINLKTTHSRTYAKQFNMKYYKGSPCNICNNTLRYTTSCTCVACNGGKRRIYYSERIKQEPRMFVDMPTRNCKIDNEIYYLKEMNKIKEIWE